MNLTSSLRRPTFDYLVKDASRRPLNMQFSASPHSSFISKHSLSRLSSNTADLADFFWVLRRVVEECFNVSKGSTASIFMETGSTFLRDVGTIVHGAEKGTSAGQQLR